MAVQSPIAALSVITTLAQDIINRIDSLAFTAVSYKSLTETFSLESLQGVDDALSLALSRVRVLRNSMSPVNSLPPEILTTVFSCLAEAEAPPFTEKSISIAPKADPSQWIPVTHVCRYWRDSALGFPFMWSPIVFEPHDTANESSLPYECLQRSLGAPLDVQVKCNGTTMDVQVWDKLGARSARLRKLHVQGLLELDQLRHLQHEAPLLQSLRIQVSPELLDKRWDGEDLPDELPELFAGYTPALRELDISVFTTFATNRFESLSILRLSHQLYRTPNDLRHLLSLLEASPNLEELSLTSCDLDFADEGLTPTDEHLFPMYRLHRLAFVSCHAGIVNSVLSHIELGDDRLALVCKDWTPEDHPITAIFPSKAASRLHPLQSITALDLNYDNAEVTATGAHTAVRLVFENDMDINDGIAPSLGFLFPLHNLQSLALAGIELHGEEFWRGLFGAMSALTKLTLWLPPTDTEKWLEALCAEGAGPYPVPQLATLCIFPPYPEIWETVTAVVRARADDGHPIRVLNVMMEKTTRDASIRRTFESLDVAALESCVGQVVLDVVSGYRQKLRVPVPQEHQTFLGQ